MQRLAPLLAMCWALPVITVADEAPSSATSSATLSISLTISERLQVSATMVPDRRSHALCLTADNASVFAVSAVIHTTAEWKLAPLAPRSTRVVTTDNCHAGPGLVYDLNPDRYADRGTVTLLLSPL